jgi:hypothetical protein
MMTTERWWRGRGWRWGAFAAFVTLLVAFEGYAWLVARSGEAAYLPREDELVAPVYAGAGASVSQRFAMQADGLEAVRLYARAKVGPPLGEARLQLVQVGVDRPIARLAVPAAALTASVPFEWTIPRVDRSAGQTFYLVLDVPDAPADRGVLLDVGPPRYAEGVLTINGRDQWGALKFSTRAARARTLDTVRDLRRRAPGWLQSELVLVAIGLAINLAIACLVYDLVFAARSRPAA